jgi:hypothetical protein
MGTYPFPQARQEGLVLIAECPVPRVNAIERFVARRTSAIMLNPYSELNRWEQCCPAARSEGVQFTRTQAQPAG